MPLERIQAPHAGMNVDASPDYVANNQAPVFENLLPGYPGRALSRGSITSGISNISAAAALVDAVWTIDDTALLRLSDNTTQQANLVALTATDVTATIGEVPASNAYARYGSKVYGAVTDATTSPALGAWSGGTIAQQTNAPYGFKDVQVFAKRLWTLGGSTPGTTTPVKKYSLFYTDPDPAADLTLLASWQNSLAVPAVNEIVFDADDTPRALASCGKFMAILGSNSINILTGTGDSSFAVRNLSKSWGVTNLESVVEADDGFYFLSTRGYCYCDGSSVRVVSDQAVTSSLLLQGTAAIIVGTLFDNGFVGLSIGTDDILLYHATTGAWTAINSLLATNTATVFRSSTYPCVWSGRSIWRLDKVTQPFGTGRRDSGDVGIPILLESRVARLGSPLQAATVSRVVVDYKAFTNDASPVDGWTLDLLNEDRTIVATATLPSVLDSSTTGPRQRAVVDVYGEFQALQLRLRWNHPSSAQQMAALEVYDAWVEYTPGQNQVGF